ncbi:MAG: O-antigen ligase family protein [Oscillospiraceae bacterium]|nr:O-antigen ligase family protein [Oscillospiraceae bacterium]
MQMIKTQWSDTRWRRALAFCAGALVLFYMVCPVAPQRWSDLYASYGKTAIIAMAAIYFFRARLDGVLEVKLVIYYTIWLFLTRLFNTDLYLQNELDLVISRILCCVVFPVGLLLDERERRVLLDVVIAVSGAYYFVTALLGLYACIFGVYFYLPPEGVVFGLDNAFYGNSFVRIVAWETTRTISAVWFYLAWCMMIYEFFRCQNRLWRIPICLALFVFHLAMAFCVTRSVFLAASVNAAMLAVLLGMKHVRVKKGFLRVLILTLLAVLSLALCYKSFEWLRTATGKVYDSMDVQIERTSDQFMNPEVVSGESANFGDSRDMKETLSNGSNRFGVYLSAIPAIRDEPLRLLIGKYNAKLMDGPHRYQIGPFWHMHNYLIQVLMLTGLVGFLLVLCFSVLLVIRMVRLYFSDNPKATADIKVLTLPVSGILLYGMLETVIFTASADERAFTDFRELFFFLIAGAALAWSYELAPRKKQ